MTDLRGFEDSQMVAEIEALASVHIGG